MLMRNKILDGIMGLAVADALGVPAEFQSRRELKKDPVTGMRSYGTYNQPAGTWSDDTSMTLCLVDSLIQVLDYTDIMQKFIEWYRDGKYTPHGVAFDIGGATRNALYRFEKGSDPLESGGSDEGDNGNGALMRILPMVFFLEGTYGRERFTDEEAMELIHNVSSLTHGHKRSKIACVIYCCIAHNLIYDNNLENAIKSGIQSAKNIYGSDREFSEELKHYKRLFELNEFASLDEDKIKSSGYVVDTFEAAIWCLLNTSSYKDCVRKAVNLGEDTDTVAAVAGGLAGIFYGIEIIPKEWVDTIVKKEYILEICEKFSKSIDIIGVKRLAVYIAYLREAKGREFCHWEDGLSVYEDQLDEFIREFYGTNLMDYEYERTLVRYIGRSFETMTEKIENADFELINAILTYHIRCDRFCNGHLVDMVKEGVLLRLVERLVEIRE